MSPNFRAASVPLDLGALGACTATAVYHYRDRQVISVILHRDDQRSFEIEADMAWFGDDDRLKIEQAIEQDAMECGIEAAERYNSMRHEAALLEREEASAINAARG